MVPETDALVAGSAPINESYVPGQAHLDVRWPIHGPLPSVAITPPDPVANPALVPEPSAPPDYRLLTVAGWATITVSLNPAALQTLLMSLGGASPLNLPDSAVVRMRGAAFYRGNYTAVYEGLLELPALTVPVSVRVCGTEMPEYEEYLSRAMTLWPTLIHPSIMPSLGQGTLRGHNAVVMPKLREVEVSQYRYHPQSDRRRLLEQIAEGLEYLHIQRGLVHGNVTAYSLCLNTHGDAVLGDFEFGAMAIEYLGFFPTATDICRISYAAPEVLMDDIRGSSGKPRSKTTASDIYAFGILVYEMLSGRPPWQGLGAFEISLRAASGAHPPRPKEGQINDPMWDLCMACWAQDPAQRPGITSILAKLRSPDSPTSWPVAVVDEPEPKDRVEQPSPDEPADFSVGSEYGTSAPSPWPISPMFSPPSSPRPTSPPSTSASSPSQSFSTCKSWASTPRRATILSEAGDHIEDTVQVEIDGADVDIIIQRQTAFTGGFSRVLKGYAHINDTIQVYAVKICEERKVMPREYSIWKALSHRNILPLCGAIESRAAKLSRSCECVFVSPYMPMGNLVSYLMFNPLAPRLPLMIDVASGLAYLHDTKEIVHGDIKAENILIAIDGRAMLADFGLSTTVSPGPKATALHVKQLYTLAYCAPEVVSESAEDPSAPGVKRSKTRMSDMYAYGVLLYQTYTGGLGRTQGDRIRFMIDMCDGKLPLRPVGRLPVLCDDIWSICTRCWVVSPGSRPSIGAVLGELQELESSPERQMIETAGS